MRKTAKLSIKSKKLLILVSAFVLILVGVGLINFYNQPKEDYYVFESRASDIKKTKVSDRQAYAWLRVQGTDIDTPIIEVTNKVENTFGLDYLWTSSNYVEGENRKVIYGHNIKNVSSSPLIGEKSHIRFEQLMAFSYQTFAKDNLYIQYSNGGDEALYKIYAVTFLDEELGHSYTGNEVSSYIKDAKNMSIYKYDVDVDDADELLSLVTCTRYFGRYEKTQFRIDARRVRKNEKINKYKVETTANYDIIK